MGTEGKKRVLKLVTKLLHLVDGFDGSGLLATTIGGSSQGRRGETRPVTAGAEFALRGQCPGEKAEDRMGTRWGQAVIRARRRLRCRQPRHSCTGSTPAHRGRRNSANSGDHFADDPVLHVILASPKGEPAEHFQRMIGGSGKIIHRINHRIANVSNAQLFHGIVRWIVRGKERIPMISVPTTATTFS